MLVSAAHLSRTAQYNHYLANYLPIKVFLTGDVSGTEVDKQKLD